MTTDATSARTPSAAAIAAEMHPIARRTWIDTAVILGLGIIAMFGFGTAFDSPVYLLAGIGGLLVGAFAALLSYRLGFGALLTVGVGIIAYYLFGSAFALSSQALFGFLPSLNSLSSLTIGAAYGWADILTLRAPVALPDYVTAVPYVTGWLISLVAVTLAARWLPTRPRTAWRAGILLIGPVVIYLAGILLGTEQPYFAALRGIAFAAIALVWLGWRRRDAAGLAVGGTGTVLRRKIIGAGIVIAAAVVVGAIVGSTVAPPAADRFVLRDQVQPPFEPLKYPAPLAGYRKYTKDLVDTTLFTVNGMQEGERIRLATMDTYDGEIWGVAGSEESSDASGSFRLVGQHIPAPDLLTSVAKASVDVKVDGYSDVWVPSEGYPSSITVGASTNGSEDEDLRYNDATGTAVLTSGLAKGSEYSLKAELQSVPTDESLKGTSIASFAPSSVTGTPDAVVAKAIEVTSSATTPVEKLRALEQYLVTTGYLSHGSASDQAPSLAGEGADRMYSMVTGPQMVGDEEQYTSLFALMARSLDYPVRIVMGFAPTVPAEGTAPVAVTGRDVTAWVEVAFEGVGWVPFYPTPKQTDVPQAQVPKPQSEPQPQVRQPPRSEVTQDDLVTPVQIDKSDDKKKKKNALIPGWAYGVAGGILIPLILIFGPMIVVGALKVRRMRRRRADASGDMSVAGAWDELVDRYSELGYTAPQRTTRIHVAADLEKQVEGAPLRGIAQSADAAVFSGREIDKEETDRVWTEVLAAVDIAGGSVSRWRSILSRYRVSAARSWAARVAARVESADARKERSSIRRSRAATARYLRARDRADRAAAANETEITP
ncbi:transglutaminase family protein [Glaciihabitans sp. dw_435]|uniref:transglutaminase-like domain-containing protein n=1 Tax=Glaciihabitans sp. dw_435 TaxID=2720081 RepID=UPI001BD250B6|nr:transglutaminase-like domain-containing protein [Glaciihabitans sp. dw_435]